jgi:hypothetical protein
MTRFAGVLGSEFQLLPEEIVASGNPDGDSPLLGKAPGGVPGTGECRKGMLTRTIGLIRSRGGNKEISGMHHSQKKEQKKTREGTFHKH